MTDSSGPVHGPCADPCLWAESFASKMQARGFAMDFRIESLGQEVDSLLKSELFLNYNQVVAEACLRAGNPARGEAPHHLAQAKYQLYLQSETGLSAYIGETLRRHFATPWIGEFDPLTPLVNLHQSSLNIHGKSFNPSQYPADYLSGRRLGTGGFPRRLKRLLNQAPELSQQQP